MSQPPASANLHTVTAADPPFLFHRGEGFERHRLPPGVQVIYPHPSLPAVPDRKAAIIRAVDQPLGMDALIGLLKPGMKVTIAFDDVSLPLPPMARPDIRQTVMEVVLERLDKAGVTDIELICAICLHRRITPAEMKHMLGPAICKRFWPRRLYNHDAEDAAGNVFLGETEEGEEVEINRRAAESDLLIYVNINLVAMDGGHKSVPVGLATYRSVRHHHNAAMLLHDSSYMDPERSAFHRSCERLGAVVGKRVKIFTIETTVNNDLYPWHLNFLQKREHDWNLLDEFLYAVSSLGLKVLPASLRRWAYQLSPAPYGMTGVHAGDTDLVHRQTLRNVEAQQLVEVPEQADIMILGMPSIGPYSVNSIMNPILAYCNSVGYFFNFYQRRPLVRPGGVMILNHPLENKFHPLHHPSYIDFFNDLLPQTRDPQELQERFEESYARNPEYIAKYRQSYAYHGAHPFYMWYWGAHGMKHLGQVIAVRPDPVAATRLGFDTAPSLAAAIQAAREFAGGEPRIAYFHCPPILQCRLP